MSQEAIDEFEELRALEDYLKEGGLLKKDCWLNPMHIRYNANTDKLELLDSVSTSSGERILGVRESYDHIWEVPYVGTWLKCDDRGEPIE